MSAIEVIAGGLEFPEGPTVADDGSIWFSELRAGRLGHLRDGSLHRHIVGGAPNGTALGHDGAVWFCDAERCQVRRLDPLTGEVSVMIDAIDGVPLDAPNDLAFHPDGSLVFTCPGSSRSEPTGYLATLHPDGTVARSAEGLLFPNGVCFSEDRSSVFLAETYGCRVLEARWGESLDFSPLFATTGPIGADGVAAARGRVHSTVYGGASIRTLDLGRELTKDTAVPDAHPAGCAADPLGRWDLIVTGAATGVLLGVKL